MYELGDLIFDFELSDGSKITGCNFNPADIDPMEIERFIYDLTCSIGYNAVEQMSITSLAELLPIILLGLSAKKPWLYGCGEGHHIANISLVFAPDGSTGMEAWFWLAATIKEFAAEN